MKRRTTGQYRSPAGGQSELTELLINYRTPLTVFLCRFVGDESVAEELCIDTFSEFWLHKNSRYRKLPQKNTLFTLAKTRAANHLLHTKQSAAATPVVALHLVQVESFSPEEAASILKLPLSEVEALLEQGRSVLGDTFFENNCFPNETPLRTPKNGKYTPANRTDEAFRQEILRRSAVKRQNRRTYLTLGLMPLLFCVVIAALIFLPTLSGTDTPPPVTNSTAPALPENFVPPISISKPREPQPLLPESHPFAEYLNQFIETIYIVPLIARPANAYACSTSPEINGILENLSKLELVSFPAPQSFTVDTVLQFCLADSSFVYLYWDTSGYILVQIYADPEQPPVKSQYYHTPSRYLKNFDTYLAFIMSKGLKDNSPHLRFEEFLSSTQIDEVRLSLSTGQSQSYQAPDPRIANLLNVLSGWDLIPVAYASPSELDSVNRIELQKGEEILSIVYIDELFYLCHSDDPSLYVSYQTHSGEGLYTLENYVRHVMENHIPLDFEGYLSLPFQSMELDPVHHKNFWGSRYVTEEGQTLLMDALKNLSLTPVEPTSPSLEEIPEGVRISLDYQEINAILLVDYENRYIELQCYRATWGYEIPADQMDSLSQLIRDLYDHYRLIF
jgi:DNA-directed RNA polymerase specialized sigma24 family protein